MNRQCLAHCILTIYLVKFTGGKESTIQRQVDLPIWENSECDKTYFQPITDNFICAGLKEGGKDACQVCVIDGYWVLILSLTNHSLP